MTTLQLANAAYTTLSAGINNSTTTIPVIANTAVGFPATAPYICRIKAEGGNADEIILVTAGAGSNSWTATRAYESYHGSSAASSHSSGATVELIFTAATLLATPQIQYPALKPVTPTYDFATATLPGAFSAHSNGGSFTTSHVTTQGIEWAGSSVELQFSEQFGQIYVTHGNTDFDFTVGGIKLHSQFSEVVGPGAEIMYGIAALDSSGTGVGVVSYTADGNGYIATISTWAYNSFSDTYLQGGGGAKTGQNAEMWIRLKRVSGTWTGYISKSGRVWDFTFATRSDSITVDRLVFGMWFDASKTYSGRLTADYFQVDV